MNDVKLRITDISDSHSTPTAGERTAVEIIGLT
jgi:hypothetical protein